MLLVGEGEKYIERLAPLSAGCSPLYGVEVYLLRDRRLMLRGQRVGIDNKE